MSHLYYTTPYVSKILHYFMSGKEEHAFFSLLRYDAETLKSPFLILHFSFYLHSNISNLILFGHLNISCGAIYIRKALPRGENTHTKEENVTTGPYNIYHLNDRNINQLIKTGGHLEVKVCKGTRKLRISTQKKCFPLCGYINTHSKLAISSVTEFGHGKIVHVVENLNQLGLKNNCTLS